MRFNRGFDFLLVAFFFSGCVASGSLPSVTGNTADGLEKKANKFIELKDGKIVEGEITNNTLGRILLSYKGSITINHDKYNYTDVMAFQDGQDGKYYRKTAYKYFAYRVIKGHINAYKTDEQGMNAKGGMYNYELYYIQKGDKEPIVALEMKVLKKMIADYQPAIDELNRFEHQSSKERRSATVDDVIKTYNSK